jgi:hypothetical protein
MAIAAQGTVLAIESATPSTFNTVGEVQSWSGPSQSYTVLDPTSITDSLKRKGLGLLNPGSVSMDLHLNYGDTGQDRVRANFAAKTRTNFKITIPAGSVGSGSSSSETVLTFAGFITSLSLGGRMDSLATCSLTIELDTVITEA